MMAMSTDQQWHEIAVGQLLVFSSPVELTPASAQGIDSAVGEWHGDGLLVRTDYGLFVDPLTGYQNRRTVRSSRNRSTANRLEGWPSIRPRGRASRRFISTT
jgi:hypothetical protein